MLFRIILPDKKTTTFSDKDLRKTLSQYVMPDGQDRKAVAKVKNVFIPENTHIGYCVTGYDMSLSPISSFGLFVICS